MRDIAGALQLVVSVVAQYLELHKLLCNELC